MRITNARFFWIFLLGLSQFDFFARGQDNPFSTWTLKHRNQKNPFELDTKTASSSKSAKYPLGDLGVFVECLLVNSFVENGFVPSQNSPLEDLTASHSLGQKQTGENLYLKFPWEFVFAQLKLNSQNLTWELTHGYFDKNRIYLPLEEILALGTALENSPCIQTQWAKQWVHRTADQKVLLAGRSVLLAWGTPGFFAGLLKAEGALQAEQISKTIDSSFEASKE
jgi:hypothetical protein